MKRKDIINLSVKLFVLILIAVMIFENVSASDIISQDLAFKANPPSQYSITFDENGLPLGTSWAVKIIMNNSENVSYESQNSTIRFSEPNGYYIYVVLSSSSYVTPEASGYLKVSGDPLSLMIHFHQTAVSEYYHPYTLLNVSQETTFSLSSQAGPSALDFGAMNTTFNIVVNNGTTIVYYKNITGQPTNFNTTTTTNGYSYVNFQSSISIVIRITNVGRSSGYFALDLWNYYISNSSASLITLPPHFQEIFGTGTLNKDVGAFLVNNNTGMSFTIVAPYYKEAVPLSIWIGEGYYDLENGKYWWAQLGLDNFVNGISDVSYGGWGVFSNYAPTRSGVDMNFPLVPNQTYTFTMESVSNGSWEFLINGRPVPEGGSAFYDAPTNFANANAYLGVEVSLASSLNQVYQGSIVIPNVESFRVNGTWEKATNISFLDGERDWEDGHFGTVAGMNIFGVEGNLQNKSIPAGEMVINNGPYTPYGVPSGYGYDVYPISGNFTFPWQNVTRFGKFLNVTIEKNNTLLLVPKYTDTEVSILRFENSSDYVYSDQNMIISHPVYIVNPAIDFKAGIFAVPLNASTSSFRYDGIFQEIALEPVFPVSSLEGSTFFLGNSSTSYSGEVYVPVYINNASSFGHLEQIYSYDPALLKFNGTLIVPSSQYVSFKYSNLSNGVIELSATGSFIIVSTHTLLFFLVFQPLLREQVSTEVLLDSSVIDGFILSGNSSSRITLAGGWRSIGPSDISIAGSNMKYGGMISDVGYSPSNISILYAASGQSYPVAGPNGYPGDTGFGGILKSTDGGKTWMVENLGLTSTAITAISVDPNNPSIVVVESRNMVGYSPVGGAIFKTVNGGASWEETYGLGGYDLQYINGTLYATTFSSIIKSENFGTTWTTVANFSGVVTSSLILKNGSKIYVGLWTSSTTVIDKILESNDSGLNFKVIANFTESEFSGKQPSISQIIASPGNSSNMWSIIDSPYNGREMGNPSLYHSSNGGSLWQRVNTSAVGMGVLVEPPTYITFDPSNGNILYVVDGLSDSIFVSTNGGRSFSHIQTPTGANFADELSIDPLNGSIMFLCSESGLFESVNAGETWVSLSNESTNLLLDMAVDNGRIFATSEGSNPLVSNNSGQSWATTQIGYLGVVAVDPYNSSVVLIWTETHASGPFFFVSDNGGSSFFQPNINLTSIVNEFVDNIAFSKDSIFVPGGAGIFVSSNGGLDWSILNGSPKDAFTVVDSPSQQNVLYSSNYSGLFESTDYGVSWAKISSTFFESLAIDPLNSSIIAGTTLNDSPYKYIAMMSYDGGKTFNSLDMFSSEYSLSSSYVYFYTIRDQAVLVFTSDQGVFVSNNLGKDWVNCTYNLPSTLVNSFYATKNGTSYVATYGAGIFEDTNLLNLSFYQSRPILTGYIPNRSDAIIDGMKVSGPGYFSVGINSGINSIIWKGQMINISATNGDVYFLNFTSIKAHYSVAVEESGLPSGTSWSVTLNETTESSATSTIFFSEPNGIYTYTVATSDRTYEPSPSSGSITVNGKNLTISVIFTEVKYTVTFTESGLPSNTGWYVNITESNGTTYDSGPISGTFYSFSLTNGSYLYSISTLDHIYKPSVSSGSFTVDGSPLSESVIFTEVTYPVTFKETGLLSGTSWTLIFDGHSYTLTNTSYIFLEPNGTYSYSATSANYKNLTGFVTVSGSSQSVNLSFVLQTYLAAFSETGLPFGTDWYVNITESNGTVYDSGPISVSSYSFSLTNGTYSYSIGKISGYNISKSSGSLMVNGKNVTQSITFSSVPSTSPPPKKPSTPSSSNTDLYIIIGAVAAVAVVGAVATIMVRKKK